MTKNADLKLSIDGRTRLRVHEKPVYRYYDDGGRRGIGNCTWGIGTLAHRGPCTLAELNRKVAPPDVEASFSERVADAERAVRRKVSSQELTSAQFDALVSFTYNVGPGGAGKVLDLVNRGQLVQAAQSISKTIYMRVKTKGGYKMVVARGLVSRRQQESAPFRSGK